MATKKEALLTGLVPINDQKEFIEFYYVFILSENLQDDPDAAKEYFTRWADHLVSGQKLSVVKTWIDKFDDDDLVNQIDANKLTEKLYNESVKPIESD
jgi:hypothetical protein